MQLIITDQDLQNADLCKALIGFIGGSLEPQIIAPVASDVAPQDADTASADTTADTEQDAGLLDSNGFPWDSRIHSSSRERIKDGTWKLKRGVDASLVESVRAAFTQPEPEQDAASVGFGEPVADVPPPPPVVVADDWPADILGAKAQPFQQFMQYCMSRMNGGFSSQKLLELANRHGLQQLAFANQFPDKIPAMVRELATLS